MLATLTTQSACAPAQKSTRHQALRWLSVAALGAVGLSGALFAFDASARGGPQSVAPLAERLIDAVVNISTSQTVKGPQRRAAAEGAEGLAVRGVLRGFLQPRRRRPPHAERKVSSLGSGFVIDGKEGLIVTNNHVIDGADEIIINFTRRHQAQGREGPRQGHQDRPGAAQGDAEEAAGRRCKFGNSQRR